ncbi:hypothetical protein ACFSUS_09390 [Spirosoma soli]|uniref:Lipoprotein n=1 Tax=Spirosoma soli TaxID=1770529 RepID=A0ABW5M2J6_9BACT
MTALFGKTTRSTLVHLKYVRQVCIWLIVPITIGACSTDKSLGRKQRIRLTVGEIKEISMSGRGDNAVELIGTSDNQEVVEVSRQQLAPAVDTLKRTNPAPTTFQLKGITIGTANVIFSEKQANDQGNGQARKTYIVQVVSK